MSAFNKFCTYAYIKASNALKTAKQNVRKTAEDVVNDESGMEIIAVLLILAVVIVLVIIFRKNIANIVNAIFGKTAADTEAALNGGDASDAGSVSAVNFQ